MHLVPGGPPVERALAVTLYTFVDVEAAHKPSERTKRCGV
jgi:hypothetical protein